MCFFFRFNLSFHTSQLQMWKPGHLYVWTLACKNITGEIGVKREELNIKGRRHLIFNLERPASALNDR